MVEKIEMPKRVLVPAWNYAKSPITVKALIGFILFGLLGYIIVHDYMESQESLKRFNAITASTTETKAILDRTHQLQTINERQLESTDKILQQITETKDGVKAMSEILKENNRVLRQPGNSILNPAPPQRKRPPAKRKIRSGKNCYTVETREKKIGNTSVYNDVLIPTPC